MSVGECYYFSYYIVKITYIGEDIVYLSAYTLDGQSMYFSREKSFLSKCTPIDTDVYDRIENACSHFRQELKEIGNLVNH